MRERVLLLAFLAVAGHGAAPALAEASPPDGAAGWLAERDRVLSGFGVEVPGDEAEEQAETQPAMAVEGSPEIVGSDVRLALTQMAQSAGSAGQARIAAAQPQDGPGAIYLRAGSATLDELFEATRGSEVEPYLTRDGEGYVASRPIVVVQGAALRLEPGDVLELDGRGGTFLLNFGHLTVTGATVRADAPPPEAEDAFRPFVVSIGTGTLEVAESLFLGLGSDIAPAASGLAVSSGSLFATSGTSVIRDSRFVDVHGLLVLDSDGARVEGNRFERPRGVAIWADGSHRVVIRDNVVTDPEGSFAARIDGPAREVRFVDNVLLDGHHTGLRIADGAAAVELRGNVVTGFAGRGIVAEDGASCLRLSGNLIRGNGGDGVSAGDIGDFIVAGNAIQANGGAGVSLARSREGSTLLVAENLIEGNRSGVRTAAIESMLLTGNDLSNQRPRHLAGDLDQFTPLLLRESRGGARVSLAVELVRAEVTEPLAPQDVAQAFEDCQAEDAS